VLAKASRAIRAALGAATTAAVAAKLGLPVSAPSPATPTACTSALRSPCFSTGPGGSGQGRGATNESSDPACTANDGSHSVQTRCSARDSAALARCSSMSTANDVHACAAV
jgi:hypothetical protein